MSSDTTSPSIGLRKKWEAQQRDTHRAGVRISPELAQRVTRLVESGEYTSKSDVLRHGAETIVERPNIVTDQWGACQVCETVRVPGALWQQLGELVDEGHADSPSQAIRDGCRWVVLEHGDDA